MTDATRYVTESGLISITPNREICQDLGPDWYNFPKNGKKKWTLLKSILKVLLHRL